MLRRKRLGILMLTSCLIAIAAGCVAVNGQGDVSVSSSAPVYNAQFAELYPNEYASFQRGGLIVEDDGLVHSHATLRYRVQTDEKLGESGLACLSCKTADFNRLYEHYGMDVFNMSYVEGIDEVVDFWSCQTCHPNGNPYEGAQATLVTFIAAGAEFAASLDPKDAACGQCHNATCDYARYIAGKDDRVLTDFNPYRYGIDADALRKATLEDGFATIYDQTAGVEVAYLGHPDIELFTNSTHEQLGLTCSSCHMPIQKSDDGAVWHSHDSSASPLDNEAAMQSCMRCHSEQGIEDTVAMRSFVRASQAQVGEMESAVQVKLDALAKAIATVAVEHSVDETTLALARSYYADASFYLTFQHASAERPGGKVAHAPEKMRDYLVRADALCNDAATLLEKR